MVFGVKIEVSELQSNDKENLGNVRGTPRSHITSFNPIIIEADLGSDVNKHAKKHQSPLDQASQAKFTLFITFNGFKPLSLSMFSSVI
jgi:hypothetical protein